MRVLALFLMPMLPAVAQIAIDHVTVAGSDLKTMRARLEAAGVPTQYGGPHASHPTEMSLTSFPDGSYIELIAPLHATSEQLADYQWGKQMIENAGPCGVAARVKDVEAEVARLRAAGVEVSAAERGGRTRPDGTRLEWETARIGPAPDGSFFPFLIVDLTPRQLRVFPSGKPTTRDFTGITRVVIAVNNLEDAIQRYHRAFGSPPAIKQLDPTFGAQLALLGEVPIILAAPLGAESWLRPRIEKFGEGPCALLLGSRSPRHTRGAAATRWFGTDTYWLDPAVLGWRLGVQPAP